MQNIECFMEAMSQRYACKRFDPKRKIPQRERTAILEIGRLSPSSFGMEPWRFLVIRDEVLKEKIRPLCWNQPQITDCSDLLLIKTIVSPLAPGGDYSRAMLSRRELPQEKIEAYFQIYDTFAAERFKKEGLAQWAMKQCYIAAANMMTGAMTMGIDSCPIEGFEKEKIEALLEMDVAQEQLALIVAFGYRAEEPPNKVRLPLEQIVTFK